MKLSSQSTYDYILDSILFNLYSILGIHNNMKPLSQLVYDYIFDSILFNLYLKSNSKKLYSVELDKVYSTIRLFMRKDDAENFIVSIAKKLNKPNFINNAKLAAYICQGRLLAQYMVEDAKNDLAEDISLLDTLLRIIITGLAFTNHYDGYEEHVKEISDKIHQFMYKCTHKVILRHADQAAKAAMIYNIAKKLNKNVQFSIKDACKIKISYEEMFDILHKRQVISIAKDAAKAANLYNKVKELNDKDTQSPILEIKDAIRISKMSSGAQNIIVTSITQPLYKKKMISIAKDAAKAANLYNKVKELNDKDTQSPVLGIKDAIRISKMSSGAQNIIVTSITQPLYKKKMISKEVAKTYKFYDITKKLNNHNYEIKDYMKINT